MLGSTGKFLQYPQGFEVIRIIPNNFVRIWNEFFCLFFSFSYRVLLCFSFPFEVWTERGEIPEEYQDASMVLERIPMNLYEFLKKNDPKPNIASWALSVSVFWVRRVLIQIGLTATKTTNSRLKQSRVGMQSFQQSSCEWFWIWAWNFQVSLQNKRAKCSVSVMQTLVDISIGTSDKHNNFQRNSQ